MITFIFSLKSYEKFISSTISRLICLSKQTFLFQKKIIDFVTQFIKINNYHEIIVFINSRARFEFVKRIIKSIARIILPSRVIISIMIIYADELSMNRDLFFEFQCSFSLNYVEEIYIYIINVSF